MAAIFSIMHAGQNGRNEDVILLDITHRDNMNLDREPKCGGEGNRLGGGGIYNKNF